MEERERQEAEVRISFTHLMATCLFFYKKERIKKGQREREIERERERERERGIYKERGKGIEVLK